MPSGINMSNYQELFNPRMVPIISKSFEVTLLRIAWYILFTSVTSVLCGYIFSRLRFRGREFVFVYLLASLLVPAIVFQVPLYVMMARTPLVGGNDINGMGGSGFINEMPALLLGGLVSAYFIFLMRQSFLGIPPDYEEAARIDGAGTISVLWNVYLPMLVPVLIVIVIGTFVAN